MMRWRSVAAAFLAGTLSVCPLAVAQEQAKWFKGNTHTHSLWSDGDDFPERIADWYRSNGYAFLGISDHNTLQQGEKWVKSADLKKKGAGPATADYLKRFPELAKTRGDVAGGSYEVRLTPFAEYKPRFDRPGSFLLIPAEEVSAKFVEGKTTKPIHINAVNLHGEAIKPLPGSSVVDVIRQNFRAIEEQGRRENKPLLVHLNHPNFQWAITAEEIAQVVEDRFFEVWNGHPIVNHEGDATRPGTEKIWDIVNTIRLTDLKASPILGVGTDDAHNYHVTGANRSITGRGWVMVRAKELSAESLLAAMHAGDFYASSGVTLADVKFDKDAKTLTVEVQPDAGATYRIDFVGTPRPAAGAKPAAADIGKVLKSVDGVKATYTLTGGELYVRAVVTSSEAPERPISESQKKQAWTQPVGWE